MALTRKLTVSCGCYGDEKKWKGIGDLSSTYFTSIKIRAKQKKWEFDLTKEFLWNLYLEQDKKCALSGLDIKITKDNGRRSNRDSSLDRINSNLGYIKSNVQWIYKDINDSKMSLQEDKFIHYCNLVNDYTKNTIEFEDYQEKDIQRHYHWRGFKEINGAYWADIIAGARCRNLEFNITMEEIWNLFLSQKGRCALTGLELSFHRNNTERDRRTASLDRINSKDFYHIKNCQWIYKDLNAMKMDKTQDYFIYLCKTVAEYQKSKLTNLPPSCTMST